MPETPVLSAADLDSQAPVAEPFASVPLWQLSVLSVASFSLYNVLWFYRHWKRQRSVEHCSPFWRAVFGVLFFQALASRVEQRRLKLDLALAFSPVALSLAYVLFHFVWRLPDPWWVIGNLSFIPLLPVQQAINDMNARAGNPAYERIGIGAIIVVTLGGLLWLLFFRGSLATG
jgi:hypothetical protein